MIFMKFNIDTRYKFNSFAPSYVATGTVMNSCEELECFWVMDCIASYAGELVKLNADYLKIITVTLNKKGGCIFKIEDEINGVLITQDIEFTDLKVDLKLWAIDEGEYTIVMFPSEY